MVLEISLSATIPASATIPFSPLPSINNSLPSTTIIINSNINNSYINNLINSTENKLNMLEINEN